VSGVNCSVLSVSDDGEWLVVATPPPESLCPAQSSAGGAGRDCGYVDLTVANPPDPGGAYLGASLSCPPFCPGFGNTGPSRTRPSAPSAARRPCSCPAFLTQPERGLFSPSFLSSSATGSSTGIYYASRCSASGLYTDPLLGTCANASDPSALLCAYGCGQRLHAVPRGPRSAGGLPPLAAGGLLGGRRGRRGCAGLPAADAVHALRGLNASTSLTQCGTGYANGGVLCRACAAAFYPPGDGSCSGRCPVVHTFWDRYWGPHHPLRGHRRLRSD